jgi:lipopolysaccharide/colanic/teichoic acid biosynthesis glycosyltransferase
VRRFLDIFIASSALFCLAIPILILMLLIRNKIGAPVFFQQDRPGLGGEPFAMVKFRTMSNACDSFGNLLPDDQRMTSFGIWLRSTSLDELPELWNVLKGDMSLVGPRPLLMEYLPLYAPHQARRHEVRPGITGWAQINGRNTLNWEEKFILDVWYVDNQSFFLDLKILTITVIKVLKRDGINQSGEVTMSKFTGIKTTHSRSLNK